MEQELERLEGTVEDIIYLNEDNGYTVFEVSGGGVVTVVCGVVGELHAGESVVCRGRYENTLPMADSSTHRSARPTCPRIWKPCTRSWPAAHCLISVPGRRTRSLINSVPSAGDHRQ